MVLRHQPPPGAAEAEREAAKASALVEDGPDHAGGYSTTRATAEDQGFERSQPEGVDAKFAPRAKHTVSRTSWLNTRADSKACQSIFLKLTKENIVRCQSLELAGWYQTVPYLRLKAM
jgi:hypothetical protein